LQDPDFANLRILIAGDLMLDSYGAGSVNRQSPEAPVEILDLHQTEHRAGGAANVALNVASLGALPVLTGLKGDDLEGKTMDLLLQRSGISTDLLLTLASHTTTHKTRYLDGSRHLLRVDRENMPHLSPAQKEQQRILFEQGMHQARAVVLQDYEKGYFTPENIGGFLTLCREAGLPVAVDPKREHFWLYRGVDLFKPNFKELETALATKIDDLPEACREARQRLQCRILLVTLADKGICWLDDEGFGRLPAHPRRVVDVCGAGDSVVAAGACALAAGLPTSVIASYANLCGGLACEYSGTHPVGWELLQSALKAIPSDNT